MILLDAMYIHNSGGKKLLEYFILHLIDQEKINEYYILFDQRFNSDIVSNLDSDKIFIVENSEIQRFFFYKKILKSYLITKIFCFNNVPPPLICKHKKVFIMFHNVLLLNSKHANQSFKAIIKSYLKSIYIRSINRRSYNWIVQSQLVKTAFLKVFKVENIHILPFYPNLKTESVVERSLKFLYVADGVKQKNHEVLILAWEILAKKLNVYPELILTFECNKFPELKTRIDILRNAGLKIVNLGVIPFKDLTKTYNEVKFLVFPSLAESFGLPLIEAAQLGNSIISADLPYVYEIIKPSAIFNPYDANELANLILSVFENKVELHQTELLIENKITELVKLINN